MEATVANLAPFTYPYRIRDSLIRNSRPNVPPAIREAFEPDFRYPIDPPMVENAAII
jgi:hypothetical protein